MQLHLGLAALVQNTLGKIGYATTDSRSGFGQVYPDLAFKSRFDPWESPWYLVPTVHFTFPGRADADGAATKYILGLIANAERSIADFRVRGGFGLMSTFIVGSGGAVTLDNGSSTTQFYRPSYASSARNWIFDLGVSRDLSWRDETTRFSWDADAWIASALTRRRSVTLVLGVSYGL